MGVGVVSGFAALIGDGSTTGRVQLIFHKRSQTIISVVLPRARIRTLGSTGHRPFATLNWVDAIRGATNETLPQNLALLFIISCIALADECDAPKGTFKITTKKKNDTVEVRADKDKAVFIVKSPSGISQAAIERLEEDWPKVVVLRFYLKGLESFRATNGKVTLDAAVSSQEKPPKARVWKDGKEDEPLNEKHPFWMDLRILGSDGKPAKDIPLKDGYFEVALPSAFFEGSPKTITLNWIDFYRN